MPRITGWMKYQVVQQSQIVERGTMNVSAAFVIMLGKLRYASYKWQQKKHYCDPKCQCQHCKFRRVHNSQECGGQSVPNQKYE